jgi:hypothetical protein
VVWVKVLALEPEGPEDQEDFALGVQPRMSGGAGVAQGSLIKVPEGIESAKRIGSTPFPLTSGVVPRLDEGPTNSIPKISWERHL